MARLRFHELKGELIARASDSPLPELARVFVRFDPGCQPNRKRESRRHSKVK
jgi:hypothetical protein